MLYRIFFAAIAFNFASLAFCQSPIDNFEFPVLAPAAQSHPEKVIVSDVLTAPTGENISTSNASTSPLAGEINNEEQLANLRSEGARRSTPTSHPIVQPMAIPSASNNIQHSGVSFPGYMPLQPSAPTPLLAYMQCQQNSCPDVWASFALQHQRDMAAYCNMKGGHCKCGHHHGGALYSEPCTVCRTMSHHHARNRYVEPPANLGCDSCTTR